jgi:hypothetical protein
MPHVASAAQPCEKLTSLKLPDTTITAASVVAAGPFVANPTAAAPDEVPRRQQSPRSAGSS